MAQWLKDQSAQGGAIAQQCSLLQAAHISQTVQALGQIDADAAIKGLLAVVRQSGNSAALQELKKAVAESRALLRRGRS